MTAMSLYSQYFKEKDASSAILASGSLDWKQFETEGLGVPGSARPVDFLILEPWKHQAKRIMGIVFHIMISIYGFGQAPILKPLLGWGTILLQWSISLIPGGPIFQFLQSQGVVIASQCSFLFSNAIMAETIRRIGVLVVKILFPACVWYIILAPVVQRLIMMVLYPAQSKLFKMRGLVSSLDQLKIVRDQNIQSVLRNRNYIVREVTLEKNGIKYDGLLVGHQTTISNGKWALQALGNLSTIEDNVASIAQCYYENQQCNVLLVNGPSVGRSEGLATPETIGDSQEVAISFLETAIKARDIVIAGHSLGGAAIGQAILQHQFQQNVTYRVVRQMSFDSVSHISSQTTGLWQWLTTFLIRWGGCEIDSVKASKKLQELKIPEIIVQRTNKTFCAGEIPTIEDFEDDTIIPPCACLGYALIQNKITEGKTFIGTHSRHNNDSVFSAAPAKKRF